MYKNIPKKIRARSERGEYPENIGLGEDTDRFSFLYNDKAPDLPFLEPPDHLEEPDIGRRLNNIGRHHFRDQGIQGEVILDSMGDVAHRDDTKETVVLNDRCPVDVRVIEEDEGIPERIEAS